MFSKKAEANKNSMIISPKDVKFEQVKDPGTIPMTCRNDNREYFVMLQDGESKTPFVLPDKCEYFDPEEYGNVLGMPAHKALFERRQNIFQKLAPFALVVAMLIIAVLFIVSTG